MNTTPTTLTATEITLIEMALNYKTREDQLSDNYSNLGLVEASKEIGISLTDTIKTLNSTEFFSVEDRGDVKGRGANYPTHAIVYITETAVNAYFDHLDSIVAPVAPVVAPVAPVEYTIDQLEFVMSWVAMNEAEFNNALWSSNKVLYKNGIIISFERSETSVAVTILDTATSKSDRYTSATGVESAKICDAIRSVK